MDGIADGAVSEIAVAVIAAVVVGVLALGPKLIGWVVKRYREARISKYISATSFGEKEILSALDGYIKPKCNTSDPASMHEMREALDLERSCLFDYVDQFIDKGGTKYLFLLADCGMGKTSFLINYFHENRSRIIPGRMREMSLVSLSRASAQGEIEGIPYEKRGSVVLLLDALDEDPLVLGDPDSRLKHIFELTDDFKATIITCRSQFFSSDDSIPNLSGVSRTGPTRLGESKEYHVDKVYLAPFDDRDISKYLRKELPGLLNVRRRVRARQMVRQVPHLAVRPMLLNHISEVMSVESYLGSQSDIYQAMISAWVKREDRWVKAKPLLDFSKLLAFDLYSNRNIRGIEACSREEIENLAGEWNVNIKTDYLTGRSLLNRFADGNFKFAHRSILEYFVAQSILTAPAGLSLPITDQISVFLLEALGCNDGVTEFIVSRSPAIRVDIISPDVRIGLGTNYSLYTEIYPDLIAPEVYRVKCLAVGLQEPCFLGELIQSAISYGGGSNVPTQVRLHIPIAGDDPLAAGYMSVWFEEFVVVSAISVFVPDVLSISGVGRSSDGEIVLVSTSATVDRMAWRVAIRCNLPSANGISFGTIERNACFGIARDVKENERVMKLIAGGHRHGALSNFGIISGGSSYSLDRQRFTKMRGYKESTLDVGRQIEQQVAVSPPAERWPSGRRS